MSDRLAGGSDRALEDAYRRMTNATRSLLRRSAWPSPALVAAATVPAASSPAPLYIPSYPTWDSLASSLKVTELLLPQGRWYVIATTSQRFSRSGGLPVAQAGHYFLVDSVVRDNQKSADGEWSDWTQFRFQATITLDVPESGALLELYVFCGWQWFTVPDPAPTQSLRQADIVAFPG